MRTWLVGVFGLLWLAFMPWAAADLPAFPGAEGFGSMTIGGREGTVYTVTNLNDSGPGSFREACQASGSRIVVFAIGGEIHLDDPIRILEPFITIAGQTAPAGGITLRNSVLNDEACLVVNTHDVIIRFIRCRPGPSVELTTSVDGMAFENGAYNVIADHCSLSWAVDEVFELWFDPHDITLQWSFVTEGLFCSSHVLGCHSKGMLLGTEGTYNVSVHHCLLAHNDERNPRVGNSGLVDFVNNVVYNPDAMGHLTNEFCTQPINYVGNYVKQGPDSQFIGPDGRERYEVFAWDTGLGFSIYVQGNIGPHRPNHTYPEDEVVDTDDRIWVTGVRHSAPSVTTYDAFEAYDRVLGEAGNIRPYRDSVDSRIVTEVINGTGHIINDPSEVGGWPALPPGTPRTDTDGDGIPDDWENDHGLDPNNPADGNGDRNGDGYTNIEEWFNGLADCGTSDGDGDSVGDLCDNCPSVSNIDQLDSDADGEGDECDLDDDGDGVADGSDNCPNDANADQADADSDGIGDVCDACPNDPTNDADGDGVCGGVDNCPNDANPNQADDDNDDLGNVCDNCPDDANPDQADVDGDGVGNVCDNCPDDPNTDQLDSDGDGVGDVCDVPADFDHDEDVDQEDFGRFQACYSGPSQPQNEPDCVNALLDNDNDVDENDFFKFLACMTAPNVPADLNCAD